MNIRANKLGLCNKTVPKYQAQNKQKDKAKRNIKHSPPQTFMPFDTLLY
jgi:hypothetical protein